MIDRLEAVGETPIPQRDGSGMIPVGLLTAKPLVYVQKADIVD